MVYGGGSIRKNGLYDKVKELLADFEIFELGGVEPNPKITSVREGVAICKKEKIDVVLYDKDPVKFIQNALSPAKDVDVRIVDEKNREAVAIVNDENSSLAIGKRGQNVKLASRLTKYKIAVKKAGELDEE